MRVSALGTVILAFSLGVAVFARQVQPETREGLIQRAEKGEDPAILLLGDLGDRAAIPHLKKLLDNPRTSAARIARITQALAKLGDRESFDKIIADLRSDDPAVRHAAVEMLGYVGNRDAIDQLIQLLGQGQFEYDKGHDPDFRGPKGEPQNKLLFLPIGYDAMLVLANIVPNPPVPPKTNPSEAQIPIWRKWWEQHKNTWPTGPR